MSKSAMRLSRARRNRWMCPSCGCVIVAGSLYCKRTGECARCWLDRVVLLSYRHKM